VQCWLGFFPAGVGVPGANDFTTLQNGTVYWFAVTVQTTWTVLQGPGPTNPTQKPPPGGKGAA
jgi:hypothetical protein